MENAEGKEEVAVVEDGNSSEEVEFHDAQPMPTIQISMHSLHGLPSHANTFTLRLKIGNYVATALVDTGSDASFINSKFAIKSKCGISEIEPVNVAAANGQEMISNTACHNCMYTIQGQDFTSTFRLLEVQGYDVILGADWIYTHSPVGLDLRKREFSICKNGTSVVTFHDETVHPRNLLIGGKKLCHLLKRKAIGAVIILNNSKAEDSSSEIKVPEELQPILSEFEDVFKEPHQINYHP